MKPSQMGESGLHQLVGTWNYVNETKNKSSMVGISGKIVYGNVGGFNITQSQRIWKL
jgi:hypothetical protein